jgi:peroxiredoxin
MSEKTTPICEYGQNAYKFSLTCTNEKIWTLDNLKGERGLLLFFICNHCPFVKAILPKLVLVTNTLIEHDINSVGIMSNDVNDYPEDSFENMGKAAKKNKFSFPYLYDETQEVAKKYGAVCTPDFFGYNASLELQYRGRLDATRMTKTSNDLEPELINAMIEISKTGQGPAKQNPSVGCSIKWK